ncbi:MAG: hypothetical protein JRH01_07285 [Deltaproteobacteria bacterium]|nr:hypothetical protein [Deltaproteobacteria bacterium]MBW2394859.1 hypothetical protein [Deltaproteobacteria bacterium]
MENASPKPVSPWKADQEPRSTWLGLLACLAIFSIAVAPDVGFSHGAKKHSAPTAQDQSPSKQEPVVRAEPETPEPEPSGTSADPAQAETARAYPPDGVPLPLAWLGKFHPSLTHFPMALLLAAALAELMLLRKPDPLFRHAVRFCVWGGAIGALLAAPLSWFFAGFRLIDDEWIMTAHRWAGTGVAAWAGCLLFMSERAARGESDRTPLRFGLFSGALLVGATGFLGGSLIYGLDHFNWVP